MTKILFGTEIEISSKQTEPSQCQSCQSCNYEFCNYCPDRAPIEAICKGECGYCEWLDGQCSLCTLRPTCTKDCEECIDPISHEYCGYFPAHRDYDEIQLRCERAGRPPRDDFCSSLNEISQIFRIIPPAWSEMVYRIYHDKSCGPEIVSKPMTKDELITFHQEITKEITAAGWQISPTKGCGGHITISIKDADKLINLEQTKIADSIFNLVSRFYPILLINSCIPAQTHRRRLLFRSFPRRKRRDKMQAIRLRDSYKIEFRYPDGTEDTTIFTRAINLIEAMVEVSLKKKIRKPTTLQRLFAKILSSKIMKFGDFDEIRSSIQYQEMLKHFKNIIEHHPIHKELS